MATTIDILMITHNRLDYTRKTLSRLLADPSEQFRLTIWDNASTDGTQEYLRHDVADPRIAEIVFSGENVGQVKPVNEIWSRSAADLVGKVDNDCLLTPGWTRTLAAAHRDIPELGVVACWHYFPDDFDSERAEHKIQQFGEHRILRHPWTCGTGLLVKRSVYERVGPMEGGATGRLWIKMAKRGYVNGFYYPLVLQEHMDDPKSEHSHLKDEDSFQAAREVTYNLRNQDLRTLEDRWQWRRHVLDNLLDDPWDVKHYTGWRGRLRRLRRRAELTGKKVARRLHGSRGHSGSVSSVRR